MSLNIFYTPHSSESFKSVYHFILAKFGQRSADGFLSKVEKTIALISEYPMMFKASDLGENIRVALITKQCSLFYLVKTDAVHLLFFWDNRQEPIF
ncbi:type II toxin-antitoxin system RelE/ParE family toxin [Pedobacter nutrimenti]|jgi:plasmid stabilization system protein ParE|uniref:Plasmid stabilization system protein ParE n=1 Tax=Pedobacter nutrimenti TaxID=1241337 RepID=A0A318U5V6_9SPHI|nr:type II toxin-antitoxin system RelE/ParE family toxin [Pedobacter nutrimenti]PYF68040.1 plasmid stabilization system protein ParE [Pedobacter nutrimenti]